MIDATFLQKASDLAAPSFVKDTDDAGKEVQFASKTMYQLKAAPPDVPTKVAVLTLQGFGELVRQKLENLKPEDYLIHIEDESTVALIAKVSDVHGRRQQLISASPVEFEPFRYGVFLGQEEFVIQVASKFADTEDRAYVVDVASGLVAGATRTSTDNGLTQEVIHKRGMSLLTTLGVRNRVQLAPYRIFPECQQPISEFLFRLRGGNDDAVPQLALFEADGGKWKVAAIGEIRRYIATLDLGVPIIA